MLSMPRTISNALRVNTLSKMEPMAASSMIGFKFVNTGVKIHCYQSFSLIYF
jgi:hypothetical protein